MSAALLAIERHNAIALLSRLDHRMRALPPFLDYDDVTEEGWELHSAGSEAYDRYCTVHERFLLALRELEERP